MKFTLLVASLVVMVGTLCPACGGGESAAGADASLADGPLADAEMPPACPSGAVALGDENYMCGTCTMDHMDGECAPGWLCACNHNCVWWVEKGPADGGPPGCFFDAGPSDGGP